MDTNVNLEAALGVLGFLGSCALLLGTFFVAVHALLKRRRTQLQLAAVAALCLVMIYLGLMLAFSFTSQEKRLARGEEKHFCEIDCHLAYAVTDVKKTKTLGTPTGQMRAAGTFYLVTVRTRFDEKTISPTRGDAPLTPNSRVLRVVDDGGGSYSPSPEAARALESTQAGGTPIETPLRPGETYTTTFVFDLPEKIERPTLSMTEGELVTYFVIGHENSPLHKKVLFQLDETPKQVAARRLSKALSFQFKGLVIAVLRRLKGYEEH